MKLASYLYHETVSCGIVTDDGIIDIPANTSGANQLHSIKEMLTKGPATASWKRVLPEHASGLNLAMAAATLALIVTFGCNSSSEGPITSDTSSFQVAGDGVQRIDVRAVVADNSSGRIYDTILHDRP